MRIPRPLRRQLPPSHARDLAADQAAVLALLLELPIGRASQKLEEARTQDDPLFLPAGHQLRLHLGSIPRPMRYGPAAMPPIISISDLTKTYASGLVALKTVAIEIDKG